MTSTICFSKIAQRLCLTTALATIAATSLLAQQSATPLPEPKNWTAAEDRQNMMQQLGITRIRPGPSGTETATNHANYDEATANPFPHLPEVLTLKNGQKVTTAESWWNQRRAEIVEEFDREVLGRVPKNVPKVHWEVTSTVQRTIGGRPVIGKQLVGRADNSSYPAISVNISMTLVYPADAKGPVPVMMMFGGAGLPPDPNAPAPARGGFGLLAPATIPNASAAQVAALNGIDTALAQRIQAVTEARSALISATLTEPRDDANRSAKLATLHEAELALATARAEAFARIQGSAERLTVEQAQSFVGIAARGGRVGAAAAGGAGLGGGLAGGDPPSTQQLIADGWGYASINPGSIQADNGAGLTRGIIGLVNQGQARKPDDWGSLRAWAWGASRGLDYLETETAVDSKKVGIEGVSRYGKAALITMAYDTRFAVVLVGSSGEGGAKLHRRNWGEAVENLTGTGEYHWMAGNFLKYGTAESSFGSKNAGDIPVDAHELIALCAPRLTFISYGVPERGDAKWLDHQGSYMAAVAAGPVFRLLGAKDLGTSDDYNSEKMPAVNVSMLNGQLAWRQHDGGHTDGPNWKYFIPWADKFLPLSPQTR